MKNRIVTMYPYSPTFTNEYRITHLVYYLSRMFDTEPKFLIKERFLPFKSYHSIELKKSLLYFKHTRSMYENIFWLPRHPPLKPTGKLASKIIKNDLGMVLFDFYDDYFLAKDQYGEKYCKETKEDYYNGLKNLFANALTLFVAEEFKNHYLNEGFEINNYLILPNASDPTLFKKTALPESKVVGHIGGFGSMKGATSRGLFLLLDAFKIVLKEHNDAKLLLCGEFGAEVKDKVKKITNGWDTEIYWDRVPHYWVPKIYQKCYVYVRPTQVLRKSINRKSKIFASASALDAAASARPVVSTTLNGIINDNGYLCKPTPDDMAEKICKLLDDRKLAAKLGLRGRTAIENEHNWENRAADLYEHLISYYKLERPFPV